MCTPNYSLTPYKASMLSAAHWAWVEKNPEKSVFSDPLVVTYEPAHACFCCEYVLRKNGLHSTLGMNSHICQSCPMLGFWDETLYPSEILPCRRGEFIKYIFSTSKSPKEISSAAKAIVDKALLAAEKWRKAEDSVKDNIRDSVEDSVEDSVNDDVNDNVNDDIPIQVKEGYKLVLTYNDKEIWNRELGGSSFEDHDSQFYLGEQIIENLPGNAFEPYVEQ